MGIYNKNILLFLLSFFMSFNIFAYDGDILRDNTQPEGGGTIDVQNIKSVISIDATTETTLESALNIGGDVVSTGMGSTVIQSDAVHDSMIDWGTGAGQVSASDMPDEDIGDITITTGDYAVEDDSHNHTGATLSGIDISDDTNLAGTANEIVLTGDTLSIHADIARDSELPTASSLSVDDLITLSGVAEGSVNLGTFTGMTIDDSLTIKAAFQDIESAIEGLPASHNVESMTTVGGAGTAPLSDGAGNLTMTDVWTEAENTAAGYLDTETDPVFGAWDKSAGISITESQISDLGNYLEDITRESIGALSDVNDTGKDTNKVFKYNAVSGDWEIGDDNNTTYTSSDFTHDDLTGFVANEHIDWTVSQAPTVIHADNYTDTNTDTQDLSLLGNTLSLTDGGSVDLSGYLDNTDAQDLSLDGNTLSLSGDATTVDLSGYLDNTDTQDLSLVENTLSLVDGGSVDLSGYLDDTDTTYSAGTGLELTGTEFNIDSTVLTTASWDYYYAGDAFCFQIIYCGEKYLK